MYICLDKLVNPRINLPAGRQANPFTNLQIYFFNLFVDS
jgi:hypothetical protein